MFPSELIDKYPIWFTVFERMNEKERNSGHESFIYRQFHFAHFPNNFVESEYPNLTKSNKRK